MHTSHCLNCCITIQCPHSWLLLSPLLSSNTSLLQWNLVIQNILLQIALGLSVCIISIRCFVLVIHFTLFLTSASVALKDSLLSPLKIFLSFHIDGQIHKWCKTFHEICWTSYLGNYLPNNTTPQTDHSNISVSATSLEHSISLLSQPSRTRLRYCISLMGTLDSHPLVGDMSTFACS